MAWTLHNLFPFHLAFPVHDLDEARAFYTDVLGADIGRQDETWIDFDLYGHQIVAHLKKDLNSVTRITNPVDGHDVPVPHFGVVLDMDSWRELSERLQKRADLIWVIEPTIRFEGLPGEQATLFILDPSGNAIEFKGFSDMSSLFAS